MSFCSCFVSNCLLGVVYVLCHNKETGKHIPMYREHHLPHHLGRAALRRYFHGCQPNISHALSQAMHTCPMAQWHMYTAGVIEFLELPLQPLGRSPFPSPHGFRHFQPWFTARSRGPRTRNHQPTHAPTTCEASTKRRIVRSFVEGYSMQVVLVSACAHDAVVE